MTLPHAEAYGDVSWRTIDQKIQSLHAADWMSIRALQPAEVQTPLE